jgi:pterin-4a-carbinolamine dehydratase
MIDYSNKICEACSVDAPKATQSEIEDFLKNHNEWYLATDVEFPQLRREFKFRKK